MEPARLNLRTGCHYPLFKVMASHRNALRTIFYFLHGMPAEVEHVRANDGLTVTTYAPVLENLEDLAPPKINAYTKVMAVPRDLATMYYVSSGQNY